MPFSSTDLEEAIRPRPVADRFLAFRSRDSGEGVAKKGPSIVFNQSDHPLPYFSHQQLDPKYFPDHIGRPCGSPTAEGDANATNATWDDDDSDAGVESEAELDQLSGAQKTKAIRKIKKPRVSNADSVKSNKLSGGRPAVAKRVTADLDSDDELIVRMKEARYLEKDIAQALIEQGRTAYNPKTIGTRWRRLKAALQKRQDELLDADLTDWHEGDDDVLIQAVLKADKEIKKQIEEVETRKWRIVADKLKSLKPVLNFSSNACEARYDALQNGTAKPTPESIADPTPEILARIQSRKDKEQKILEGTKIAATERENMEMNGWTSRMRTYF